MKRSKALILIANQLDFLTGDFEGYREDYSATELGKADVILTTLESAGMVPLSAYNNASGDFYPASEANEELQDCDSHIYFEWEPEDVGG